MPVCVLCRDRETRVVAVVDRAPVPAQEVNRLRALFVGLFALVVVTQAAAAASGGPSGSSKTTTASTRAPKERKADAHTPTLDEQLERRLNAVRKTRGTIRFYENHPELLRADRSRTKARASLRTAQRQRPRLESSIARLQVRIERRDAQRIAKLSPRAAICDVFKRYCQAAVAVAWCESRLDTNAQNGQYLGLFQMGSSARRIFGHGPTAHEQAIAAYKYFVESGRDWSPWTCRWAAV